MEEKFKITLINKADFVFDERSYKTVDKPLFDMLVGAQTGEEKGEEPEELPEVYVFKNKDEYVKNAWKYDIDATKPVYVNDKNQIFCFRGWNDKATNPQTHPRIQARVG